MTVDRNKGVQWMINVTPEQPVIPVTVLETDETFSEPPVILYSGPFNKDIVTALAEHGYTYNYDPMGSPSDPDNFLMYRHDEVTRYLLIIADTVTLANGVITHTTDQFKNMLMFNSGVNHAVTKAFTIEHIDDAELLRLKPIDPPYTGICTAIECRMAKATSEPDGPEIMLISNISENHLGVEIGVPSTVATTLTGPQGGTVLNEKGIGVCLSPIAPIVSEIDSDTTMCVKMEGLFAIEINGEMVPYYFSEKDLIKFFNKTNPYGIEFLNCDAPIACVPIGFEFPWRERESMDGAWALNYSFNDGPILRWEEIDQPLTNPRDLFDKTMWGIFETPGSYGAVTGGGGGMANFRILDGSIYGGQGGPLNTPIKVTFHRMTEEYGGVDLFEWFFDFNGTMSDFSILSCGEQYWPGLR